MATNETGSVKSAMRTLDVLELFVDQNRPMAAVDVAAALAIPMSSLSYLLSTLTDRGYLRRAGRLYEIGPGIERFRPRPPAVGLVDLATPIVRLLRQELNETACFFIRRGFEIEALVSEVSSHALQYRIDVGERVPLHNFAGGKVVLASLTDEELGQYFAMAERADYTAHTLRTEAQLRAEIDRIRDTGIAYAREEHTLGIVSVGRAVRIGDAELGAISLAIPLTRYDDEVDRTVRRALKNATAALESAISSGAQAA